MAKEFLDHPEVRSPVEQMGGIGVSKGVGVRGLAPSLGQDAPNIAGPKPRTPPVQKQGPREGRLGHHLLPGRLEIALDPKEAVIMDGELSLLGPLAEHGDAPSDQIDVIDIETAELANTESRRIEQLENHLVPHGEGIPLIDGSIQEFHQLGRSDELRQARRGARSSKPLGGVNTKVPSLDEPREV